MNCIDHSQGIERQHNRILRSITRVNRGSDRRFIVAIAFTGVALGLTLILQWVSMTSTYSMFSTLLEQFPDAPELAPPSMSLLIWGSFVFLYAFVTIMLVGISSWRERGTR